MFKWLRDKIMKGSEESFNKGIDKNTISTACIDGYKFVYIKSGGGTGQSLAIVQAFEERNEKSLPAKC